MYAVANDGRNAGLNIGLNPCDLNPPTPCRYKERVEEIEDIDQPAADVHVLNAMLRAATDPPTWLS